jgi:hypothetical protein
LFVVVIGAVVVVIVSAITAPENAPAATSPRAKRKIACRYFTGKTV